MEKWVVEWEKREVKAFSFHSLDYIVCYCYFHKLKIISYNVSNWYFMTSYPRLHIWVIFVLTRYITSILCAFIIFRVRLVVWGTKINIAFPLLTTSFTHKPPTHLSVEIWCIMYVNDTKIPSYTFTASLWHEEKEDEDDLFIQDNLNLLDS